ncbi:hypothetical protein H5410_035503 [Solanum commersonii]|uniref:Uncharacterized protein n=1 Tax=Solanum commersonii TaxID=4109 RepID=A0A9J5Y326_SOLCO|nr:hypothetical protein H5410_035503 [Solanum commersonii]
MLDSSEDIEGAKNTLRRCPAYCALEEINVQQSRLIKVLPTCGEEHWQALLPLFMSCGWKEIIEFSKYMSLRGYYCEKDYSRVIANATKRGKKYLVHECFKEVDHPTAFDLTFLVILCTYFDPDKRPTMKDVIDALNAMGMRGDKQKEMKMKQKHSKY